MSGFLYTYDEVAFGIPDDGMDLLWSETKPDGSASIMKDGDSWWICVNGQALELSETEVRELVRLVGDEVDES